MSTGHDEVHIIGGQDPTAEFWVAHRAGRLVGLHTSGTTGSARTVVRATDSWVSSFTPLARLVGFGADSRLWIPGPMSATMNLFAACLCEWVGASWGCQGDGADWVTLTPSHLARLLPSTPPMNALVAGDTLPHRLRDEAVGRGWRVWHYYGAAELSMVAVGTSSEDLRPFDDVEIKIIKDRIWVRSPWLSRGYLHPDESAPLNWREDGFASVGDRGGFDGERVEVWGRTGAITTGGITVDLAPVQAALRTQAAGQVVVVGVPHQRLGQVLGMALTEEGDLEPVRHWAREHLPAEQRPRRWIVLPQLPLTSTGKTDLPKLAGMMSR